MKNYFLTCCIIFTATLLMTSCKKDNVIDPTTTFDAYFDSKEGSFWIYDNYVIAQDGDEEFIQKLVLQDTLTQGANKVELGKDAIQMRHRFINPIMSTSTIANYLMAEDKNARKLYVNDEFLKILVPDMLQEFWNIVFPAKWYLLADAKSTKEWTMDSFLLADAEMPGPSGMTITLNGHLKFVGKKEKDTTITTMKSHTYSLNIFFEGNAIVSVVPYPVPVRIEFKKIDFYLGEKKGLLGLYSPVSNILLTTEDAAAKLLLAFAGYPNGIVPLPVTLEGFDKRLVDISIK